jgi:hypothetical protein
VFGGFDGSRQRWLNDMHEFNFRTKTWKQIFAQGTLPSARSCPAWVKDSTHVYIQGGYDGVERKSDFFACDLSSYTWQEMLSLGTTLPSPRYFHSCCLHGNNMYVYGGYSGVERLNDVFVFNFDSNHWTQVMANGGDAPSGRSSHVAQIYENSLYVFGGYNGIVLNDFYRFKLIPIEAPPPALVSDLVKLLNNPELSDVHFIVEGKDVYAHKAILSVRSEYFQVMLCGGKFREGGGGSSSGSLSSSDEHAPIELPDVSYDVFLKVLEYLYTDTLNNVSIDTAILILIASELFMLDRLKALCEDLIRRDICVDNVVSIVVAAHRHNACGLKDLALDFILAHLNDPLVMTGLSELKVEPDLLLEIIKRKTATPAGTGANGGEPLQDAVGPFGAAIEWNFRR